MGTRLRTVVADVPKPMAPVAGKPFLHYQFLYLKKQGIERVILSVGYLSHVVEDYFGDSYEGISIQYSIEDEPLGTGGAIKKAIEKAQQDCFVLNGDTFFDVSLSTVLDNHISQNADATLALSHQTNFDRYGSVDVDTFKRVNAFKEKQFMREGWINGGVYLLSHKLFDKVNAVRGSILPQKFSFETEVLEQCVHQLHFAASLHKNYFIDIGIPEDYARANQTFPSLFTP